MTTTFLYNKLFPFLFQQARFYYDDLPIKKRAEIETKILREFRNGFLGQQDLGKNTFYLQNQNITIKFLFWETDISVAPLKNIAKFSDTLFLVVKFSHWGYDIRVWNLPLVKRAFQVNPNSAQITWSVKWAHIVKVFNLWGKTLPNTEENIIDIHNAIYQNYNIHTEIRRIYWYHESANEIIEAEQHFILTHWKDFLVALDNCISDFNTPFIYKLSSNDLEERKRALDYMTTLLSLWNTERQAMISATRKVALTWYIPDFNVKNKLTFVYQWLSGDIHFIINGYENHHRFMSESRSLNKIVLFCFIDMRPLTHISTYILQWQRSKKYVRYQGEYRE